MLLLFQGHITRALPVIFTPGTASLTISVNYGDPTSGTNTSSTVVPPTSNGSGTLVLNHQYVLPTGTASQVYTVTVTVNDGTGGVASSTLQVDAVSPSQTPIINPITAQTNIYEGQTLTFNVVAQDPQSLPLTITYANLPSGATVTPAGNGGTGTSAYTSTFTWTPATGTAGTYSVLITATDTLNLKNTINVVITVTAPPPSVTLTINSGANG